MLSPEGSLMSGLVIEGGGSHTSMAYYSTGPLSFELHGEASNPRSVSDGEATDVLKDMLSQTQERITESFSVYAAHGAASTPHEAKHLGEKIRDLLEPDFLTQVVVVNDLVPLALPQSTENVFVAAAGTGTGYLARSSDGRWHRASGYEFMLSDEGGGFDLGQKVLRAVIKELDGRGESTALTELVMDRVQCARSELQEKLFDQVYQRQENIKHKVATFADIVFMADTQGDKVAGMLLDDAAAEVAAGLGSLERSVGESSERSSLILTGSLLTARPNLRDRVLNQYGFESHYDVSILGSVSLLDATSRLMGLDNSYLRELEQSRGIPFYVWKGEKNDQ